MGNLLSSASDAAPSAASTITSNCNFRLNHSHNEVSANSNGSKIKLLAGCNTVQQHSDRIRLVLRIVKAMQQNEQNEQNGGSDRKCSESIDRDEEILNAIGFEYRFVPCSRHSHLFPGAEIPCEREGEFGATCDDRNDEMNCGNTDAFEGCSGTEQSDSEAEEPTNEQIGKINDSNSLKTDGKSVHFGDNGDIAPDLGAADHISVEEEQLEVEACHECATRLFYVGLPPSSTNISSAEAREEAPGTLQLSSEKSTTSVPQSSIQAPELSEIEKITQSFESTQLMTKSDSSSRCNKAIHCSFCTSVANTFSHTSQTPALVPASSSNEAKLQSATGIAETSLKKHSKDSDKSSEASIHAEVLEEKSCNQQATQTINPPTHPTKTTKSNGDEHVDTVPPFQTLHSPVMITSENRQLYIADGIMYDMVANLAQRVTQEHMREKFDLEWVTICEEKMSADGIGSCEEIDVLNEPVRALVDRDHWLAVQQHSQHGHTIAEKKATHEQNSSNNEEKKDDSEKEVQKVDSRQQPSLSRLFCSSNISNHSSTSASGTDTTLLIVTGRGKVRAGIFSRNHLLTSGMEKGSAWQMVVEAQHRGMGVAILDPNARGEGRGMETFTKSMSRLFPGSDLPQLKCPNGASIDTEIAMAASSIFSSSTSNLTSYTSCPHKIYILAHSASGGQLVRHLLQDPDLLQTTSENTSKPSTPCTSSSSAIPKVSQPSLPTSDPSCDSLSASSFYNIKAIAFTDSTHNVQWCKKLPTLMEMLQSNQCLYIRSNDVRALSGSFVRVSSHGKEMPITLAGLNSHLHWDEKSSRRRRRRGDKYTGMPVETDHFWEHRFGTVPTLWAGTADHSLTNWAGHDWIWKHFDHHLEVAR